MNVFQLIAVYFSYPFVRYAFIAGVLTALCASVLGVTLVLKRYSFIGDGLSHVAFGAMAIAAVLSVTNEMIIVMPLTVLCAVLLLAGGSHAIHVLFRSAAQVIQDWALAQNKKEQFQFGMVCVLHTFGRDLKWNPHIHMLLTEGACGKISPWKSFHYFPYVMLRKRWMTTLLYNLRQEILSSNLSDTHFLNLVNRFYRIYKDGFYVHAPKSDFNSASAVTKYIVRYIGRPAMAQSRIINYDGSRVTFWYQRHEDNEKVVECVPAHDFIKRLIIHIPEK